MIIKMVGARGFEPPTPDTPCQCATRLRYAPTMRILRSEINVLTDWESPNYQHTILYT